MVRRALTKIAPAGALYRVLGDRGRPMTHLGRRCFDHGFAVLMACDLVDRGYRPRIVPWTPRRLRHRVAN